MPNQITPADRRQFWLIAIIPAALVMWSLFLCIFGE